MRDGELTVNAILKAKPYPRTLADAIADNIHTFRKKNQSSLERVLIPIEGSVRKRILNAAQLKAAIHSIDRVQTVFSLIKNKSKEELEMEKNLELWRADLSNYERKLRLKKIWTHFYGGNKKTPQKFDPQFQKQSIIASVIYLQHIHELIEPEKGWSGVSEKDQFLYTIGAYNAGERGLDEDCDTSQPLSACLSALEKNNLETFRHISSIKNCAENGNFNPMSGTDVRVCK